MKINKRISLLLISLNLLISTLYPAMINSRGPSKTSTDKEISAIEEMQQSIHQVQAGLHSLKEGLIATSSQLKLTKESMQTPLEKIKSGKDKLSPTKEIVTKIKEAVDSVNHGIGKVLIPKDIPDTVNTVYITVKNVLKLFTDSIDALTGRSTDIGQLTVKIDQQPPLIDSIDTDLKREDRKLEDRKKVLKLQKSSSKGKNKIEDAYYSKKESYKKEYK
ncbi:hypothetical protein KAW80_04500 [Candidatus Babeliales bacterium]|nr:hypothetical protein [Candidatus Babeliales bacterium]